MFEMYVPVNDTFNPSDVVMEEVVKAASENGYVTTKRISDILKPESISDDLIVSELTWWSCEELNGAIQCFGEPIARPGYVVVRFPQYHTGPYPASNNEEGAYDVVSHPSHYTEGRKYEPRKVIADWGLNFNLGNAVKYLSRAGRKGDKIEDLRKAIQYIEFELEELGGGMT